MSRFDKVALRCPHCGSLAAGRVAHEDHVAGRALVKCIACKREVRVPVPDSYWKGFIKETRQTLGLYAATLQAMGWGKVILFLIVWVGGWYLLSYVLKWPSWISILVPAVPFIYVFSRYFVPRMQAQVQGELGVIRVPRGLRGLSERDPISIKNPGEAIKLSRSRSCTNCGGNFQVKSRQLVLPNRSLARFRFRFSGKAVRLYDRVDVFCPKCGNQGSLFYDISSLDLVQKYGYSRQLIEKYPKSW